MMKELTNRQKLLLRAILTHAKDYPYEVNDYFYLLVDGERKRGMVSINGWQIEELTEKDVDGLAASLDVSLLE